MPGKRSRLTRSQSFGDVGLVNDRLSLGDGGFTSDNMADQSIQRIIDVSPPRLLLPEKEKDIGGGLVETEHFLERCDLCKKRLSQKQDVYMYGYLGAFCSPECRDARIAIDKRSQEVRGQSIGTRASSSRKDAARKAEPQLVYN
uniref:FLZ-type domain-containing protein n=1 Tax=Salix viminalis TaxID=40686 RepID=A0A6N2MRR1_SALVM